MLQIYLHGQTGLQVDTSTPRRSYFFRVALPAVGKLAIFHLMPGILTTEL